MNSGPQNEAGLQGATWLWSDARIQWDTNSSVQLLNRVWLSANPQTAARQACLSITNSQSLLKLMSIKSVISSNHLILCHSLLLRPSILPRIRVFSNESVLCTGWPKWLKYWSFSYSLTIWDSSDHMSLRMVDLYNVLEPLGCEYSPQPPATRSICLQSF